VRDVHVLVQVLQAPKQLLHDVLYLGQAKAHLLVHEARDVVWHVVEK
jgi:hypothetical protein